MHFEDFHNLVAVSNGCVTCQGYHPTEKPLVKVEWIAKQDDEVSGEVERIETDIDELCESLKLIKRSDAE